MTTFPRRKTFLDMNSRAGGRDMSENTPDISMSISETQPARFTLQRSEPRANRTRRDAVARIGSGHSRDLRQSTDGSLPPSAASAPAQAVRLRFSGSWLTDRLGTGSLKQRYLSALAPIHNLLFDRRFEKLLFKPSEIGKLANGLDADEQTPDTVRQHVSYDGPIHNQVFRWVLSALPNDLREYAFVDFRAGRGRTLLYAAMHEFDQVVGFEYEDLLHDDALMNVAQFPRSLMKCRNVTCRRGDLDGITIPDQPAVLFFPNAFRERFMALIMNHVSASYRLNPRRIYVIMENPGADSLTGQEDIFYELKLPVSLKMKLNLLSPVNIKIYRSLV